MTSPPEPMEPGALPKTGPNGERLVPCAACGAPMYFKLNPATGKRVPIALATGESHFKDCIAPGLFSRRGSRAKGEGEG